MRLSEGGPNAPDPRWNKVDSQRLILEFCSSWQLQNICCACSIHSVTGGMLSLCSFFFFSFSVLELKLKESELGNLDIEHASPKREWLEVLASRMP